MSLSEILERSGWSLDLTPQENIQAIQREDPIVVPFLYQPVQNDKNLVIYYPISEKQNHWGRVLYTSSIFTPLDLLMEIARFYKTPISERMVRAIGRSAGHRFERISSPSIRDLLGEHTTLTHVLPHQDGYALYFA